MNDLINRRCILNLNGNWQAISIRSPKEMMIAMNGGDIENPPVRGLDINYPLKDNGEYDFESMPSIVPCSWIEWISLPIREYDAVLNTTKLHIRIPSVCVSINYHKIPKKRLRASKNVLYELQKGIDGYTGLPLKYNRATLEHKTPRSHGGKDTFENLIVVDKDINHKRGNKPLHEVGLVPLFSHKQPAPLPVNFTIKNLLHPDWKWFLGIK